MRVVLTASDAAVVRPFAEGDCSTGVESEGLAAHRESVVRRRLVPHSSRSAFRSKRSISSPSRSRALLEKAFDEGNGCFSELSSFWEPFLIYSSNFSVVGQLDPHDSSSTPFIATGHQLVTLCRAICEEEREQILDPLMQRWYLYSCSGRCSCFACYTLYWLCLQE